MSSRASQLLSTRPFLCCWLSHVCEPWGWAIFIDFPKGGYVVDHRARMEKTASWFIFLLLSEAAGQGHRDPSETRISSCAHACVFEWCSFQWVTVWANEWCWCLPVFRRRMRGLSSASYFKISERSVLTPGCHCLRLNDALIPLNL